MSYKNRLIKCGHRPQNDRESEFVVLIYLFKTRVDDNGSVFNFISPNDSFSACGRAEANI